jgi:hypothetical protein
MTRFPTSTNPRSYPPATVFSSTSNRGVTHMAEDFASKPELYEPSCTAEIFCSELAIVERIGPCLRLIFAVEQTSVDGRGRKERAVTARLIIPAEAVWPPAAASRCASSIPIRTRCCSIPPSR